MNKSQYLKNISKELLCTKQEKKRILEDLDRDIEAVIAVGESIEDVIERMGTPKEVALEFNENCMAVSGYRKGSKLPKIIFVLLMGIVLIYIINIWIPLQVPIIIFSTNKEMGVEIGRRTSNGYKVIVDYEEYFFRNKIYLTLLATTVMALLGVGLMKLNKR